MQDRPPPLVIPAKAGFQIVRKALQAGRYRYGREARDFLCAAAGTGRTPSGAGLSVCFTGRREDRFGHCPFSPAMPPFGGSGMGIAEEALERDLLVTTQLGIHLMKILAPVIAGAAMIAAPAAATVFTISGYTVDAYGPPSQNGLEIAIDKLLAEPTTFELDEGESVTFDLFIISTPEDSLQNDDENAQPINLGMTFSQPLPNSGAGTTGETEGWSATGWFGIGVSGATLQWVDSGAFSMSYGPLGDGLLTASVNDAEFAPGICGLGSCTIFDLGALVSVTFTNMQDATAAVPAPGALGLLGLGLLGLGAATRRRMA